jgi:hypothetical protein
MGQGHTRRQHQGGMISRRVRMSRVPAVKSLAGASRLQFLMCLEANGPRLRTSHGLASIA